MKHFEQISREKVFEILNEANPIEGEEMNEDQAMRYVMTYMKGHANPNYVHGYILEWLQD